MMGDPARVMRPSIAASRRVGGNNGLLNATLRGDVNAICPTGAVADLGIRGEDLHMFAGRR